MLAQVKVLRKSYITDSHTNITISESFAIHSKHFTFISINPRLIRITAQKVHGFWYRTIPVVDMENCLFVISYHCHLD
jgi:hypothetical protein